MTVRCCVTFICRLLQRGVEYAFEAVPSKLPFLKGLSQVCTRLPARQADLLLTHMQQALTGQSPQEGDPEWEDYWEFVAIAQERASKGAQPRSALKGRLPCDSTLCITCLCCHTAKQQLCS